MIVAPQNAWCRSHSRLVMRDRTANAVWCAIRLVTRTLEIDKFTEQFDRTADGKAVFDEAKINAALAAAAPLCCYLGDEEMRLIVVESRGIAQRRS